MSDQAAMERRRAEVQKGESAGSAALWFGVLGGPLAWSIQIFVNYNMEESFLCAPGMGTEGQGQLYGIALDTWITAFNVVLVVLAAASVVVALRSRRRLRNRGETTAAAGRARWMAVAGIIVGVASIFVIAVGFAPTFFLDACMDPL